MLLLLLLLLLIRRNEPLCTHAGGHVPHLVLDFLDLDRLVLKDGQVVGVVGLTEDGREGRDTLGLE